MENNRKNKFLVFITIILLSYTFFALALQLAIYYYKDKSAVIFNDSRFCKRWDRHEISSTTTTPEDKKCVFSGSLEKLGLKGLNLDNCERLSEFVITDRINIYKRNFDPGSSADNTYLIIDSVDPLTINYLNYNFYQDNSGLYYDTGMNMVTVEGVDINSVKVLSIHYLKDSYGIHLFNPYNIPNVTSIRGYDLKTFEIIQNQKNHENYFKDKNGVYYNNYSSTGVESLSNIPGANPQTFEVLNYYQLARDKNNVYYKGEAGDIADPSSFEIIGPYFRDYINVYYLDKDKLTIIPESDGCTFELVSFTNEYDWKGYSKDKNNVYYRDNIVNGA
ncbi:conserved hypothetical protein, secreted, partial [sediment metagenome]